MHAVRKSAIPKNSFKKQQFLIDPGPMQQYIGINALAFNASRLGLILVYNSMHLKMHLTLFLAFDMFWFSSLLLTAFSVTSSSVRILARRVQNRATLICECIERMFPQTQTCCGHGTCNLCNVTTLMAAVIL
jgi:hypothetical protein